MSIRLFGELKDESECLNAMDGLAMTYLAQGEYGKASIVIQQALDMLPKIKDMPNYDYLFNSLINHLQEAKQRQ